MSDNSSEKALMMKEEDPYRLEARRLTVLDRFEIGSAFASISKDVLSSVAGDTAKSLAASAGANELFAGIAEETLKSVVGEIAGPLLRVILRLTDKTQAKLDKLIREPFTTGVEETRQALAMGVLTPEDRLIQREQFLSAIRNLDKAFSLADERKQTGQRFYIRFLQALIGMAMNAPGYVGLCLRDLSQDLTNDISDAENSVTYWTAVSDFMQRKLAAQGTKKTFEVFLEREHDARQFQKRLWPRGIPPKNFYFKFDPEAAARSHVFWYTYGNPEMYKTMTNVTEPEVRCAQRKLEETQSHLAELKSFERFLLVASAGSISGTGTSGRTG